MYAQPTLETPRLRLRPFVPDDAPAVQRLAGAREIADATLTIPHPYPDGAAALWIARLAPAWAVGAEATFAVTAAADGLLLGAAGVVVAPEHQAGELGYWVGVPYWGCGYATEAARALCGYAFTALAVHRIQARHLTRNPASGRVMQKLGMRREGVLRDAIRKWGRFEDVAVCSLLAPEWAPPR